MIYTITGTIGNKQINGEAHTTAKTHHTKGDTMSTSENMNGHGPETAPKEWRETVETVPKETVETVSKEEW